ncbi:hypothetical protein [Xenophilus sp.]|uniref:hypothetical protein n=1 Tax=Xenophilus sp. TaxID=1873499 RepID=UPI0037DD7253
MFRSEKLRRAVADLPCAHCGREGATQAAHANLLEYGKGRGMKASDAALMALCADCHRELDQGRSMDKAERREFQQTMIARTLVRLIESGRLVLA